MGARKNETLPAVVITVRRVNLCEHAASSPEQVVACAGLSALCRRMGLGALADATALRLPTMSPPAS